jgi:hypothetical protein
MVIDSSVDIQAMKFEAFFLARRLSDAGRTEQHLSFFAAMLRSDEIAASGLTG